MVRTQDVVEDDGSIVRRKPVDGDMRWDGQVWRRWNGRTWVRATYALHPEQLRDPQPFQLRSPIDDHRRQRVLSLAVEDQVAQNAASVVLEGPNGVVMAYRRPVSHFLHGVLTILTGGLWGVVWVVMAIARHEDRRRFEVDDWGNVWVRRVAGR